MALVIQTLVTWAVLIQYPVTKTGSPERLLSCDRLETYLAVAGTDKWQLLHSVI